MKLLTTVFSWLLALVLSSLQTSTQPADRFDMLVRADFFAGFSGDAARLARGMETCQRVLSDNPRHAEAMVWHGSGLIFEAGSAFASHDEARGIQLWAKGLREVDEAVTLAPNDVGVLIPRSRHDWPCLCRVPPVMA